MTTFDAALPEVPGYQVIRMLGRGGFATVFEARQISVDRLVALKVVHVNGLEDGVERRFRAEIKTVGSLSWHPNVVALHDAGVSPDGTPFLAMELVGGGSWGDRVRKGSAVSIADALDVGAQVADALHEAHLAGIIHRDVKPDNVLVGRRGEALLADFGIATLSDHSGSVSGTFVGTIAYSAPELLKGTKADAVSDVYSVGATMHTLVAGSPAFVHAGDTPAAIMHRVLYEPAPPLPTTISGPVRDAIVSAMAHDRADRPQSAAALASLLRELRADLDRPASRPASSAPGTTEKSKPGPKPPARPDQSGPHPVAAPPPRPATSFPPAPTGPEAVDASRPGSRPPAPQPPPTTATPPPVATNIYGGSATTAQPYQAIGATPPPMGTPPPVSVPVYEPQPTDPPLPPQPPSEKPYGLWACLGRGLLAMVCCAPIAPLFAVQAHRRLVLAGGRLREPASPGWVLVVATYVLTVLGLIGSIALPVVSTAEIRDLSSRYAGTWESQAGASGQGLTVVELEREALGLGLKGTYAVVTADNVGCQVDISTTSLEDGAVRATLDTADCQVSGLVPRSVLMSLSDDGQTLELGPPVGVDLRRSGG